MFAHSLPPQASRRPQESGSTFISFPGHVSVSGLLPSSHQALSGTEPLPVPCVMLWRVAPGSCHLHSERLLPGQATTAGFWEASGASGLRSVMPCGALAGAPHLGQCRLPSLARKWQKLIMVMLIICMADNCLLLSHLLSPFLTL